MKKIKTKGDTTRNERQARLRITRRKWLEAHGFKSSEGLIGALIRGEYTLTSVSKKDTKK